MDKKHYICVLDDGETWSKGSFSLVEMNDHQWNLLEESGKLRHYHKKRDFGSEQTFLWFESRGQDPKALEFLFKLFWDSDIGSSLGEDEDEVLDGAKEFLNKLKSFTGTLPLSVAYYLAQRWMEQFPDE